jgi:hypothetical protein
MYNLFIISYSGSKSPSVKEIIKSLGAWSNHFDNQYMLCTTLTIDEVKAYLDNVIIQGQDKLLILEVSLKGTKGWISKTGWDWIKSQKIKLKK